jgi:hypothetical protein
LPLEHSLIDRCLVIARIEQINLIEAERDGYLATMLQELITFIGIRRVSGVGYRKLQSQFNIKRTLGNISY